MGPIKTAWTGATASRKWLVLCALACAALVAIIAAGIINRHSWNWGDFPGWIAAAATAGLLIGAGATVHFARKAFGAQSQQLADQQAINTRQADVLDLQVKELEASLAQRRVDAERERRAQANQVAAWFGPEPGGIVVAEGPVEWGALIRNDSGLPIVNTRVSFHFVAADSPASLNWKPIFRGGPPERIRVIPPHSERFVRIPEDIRRQIKACDDTVYVVSIEFGDAAGNYWERNPRGALIPTDPGS